MINLEKVSTTVKNEVLARHASLEPVAERNYPAMVFGLIVLAVVVLSACGVVS